MAVILAPGSFRFGWFGRFVKADSNFSFMVSVTRKSLPKPMDRFTVPGPTRVPTPALPKRAIGATLQSNWLAAPAARPGHIKADRFQNRSAVGFDRLGLVPAESGRCVPRVEALVPDGSPPLIVALRNGPVCSTRMELTCQPSAIASTARPALLPNLRPLPNGNS